MSQNPKIAIMILNYNGLRWLPKCLASVTRTDYPNYDVYLIDNGSVDKSIDYVTQNFPSVKIIRNDKNLGFAEAYARAIDSVDADQVLLLNNDTEVLNTRWVKSLVKKANNPGVAAVNCKMVSMKNYSILDSIGGMGVPFWRGFVDIGKGETDARQYDSETIEPFAFCGGAALINVSAFKRAKGFDRKLFSYFEDVDLSWRFRLLGYRIEYSPDATVAHFLGGSSVGPNKSNVFYYCHRNLLRTIIKNCGWTLKWAFVNYLLYSTIIMGLGSIAFRPTLPGKVLRGILWNIYNFRDTYRQRLLIQANRHRQEEEILDGMFPNLPRHQSSESHILRVMNILFESSQRRRFEKLKHKVTEQTICWQDNEKCETMKLDHVN